MLHTDPRRTWRQFVFLLVVVAAFSSSEEIADQQRRPSDATCVDSSAHAKDVSDPECTNNNAKCNDWADQGECVANPAYMLKECMEACGVCGSGTDQDEANDSLQEECADQSRQLSPVGSGYHVLQHGGWRAPPTVFMVVFYIVRLGTFI